MKPFRTLDEQINILKNRNLNFKNENKAKEYLLKYNYYNVINCYSKYFCKSTNIYDDNVYIE